MKKTVLLNMTKYNIFPNADLININFRSDFCCKIKLLVHLKKLFKKKVLR